MALGRDEEKLSASAVWAKAVGSVRTQQIDWGSTPEAPMSAEDHAATEQMAGWAKAVDEILSAEEAEEQAIFDALEEGQRKAAREAEEAARRAELAELEELAAIPGFGAF